MSLYKITIDDDAIRDIDSDNILEENRIECRYILGLCIWKKVSNDKNEYVKIKRREMGYGKGENN